MAASGKVLIYAEDPGACNYLREIPDHLTENEIESTLLCAGAAVNYLTQRGVDFTAIEPSDTPQDILDKHSPALMIVGTSEQRSSLAHELTDLCRDRSITTVGAVDMEANADRRFRGITDSPLRHAPDWLLVPDRSCAEAFEKLSYRPERIVVAGHPHYDFVRRAAQSLNNRRELLRSDLIPGIRPQTRIVTFVCEGYDLLNRSASLRQNDYSLYGRRKSDFRTAIVLEELIDALETVRPKPFLIARLHPKMSGDELSAYFDEIDYLSSSENPLEILAASDLIVGMSSILLQESVIMGRPTIAILPRKEEKQWLSVTAHDHIRTLFTRKQIRDFMTDLDSSIEAISGQAQHDFSQDSLTTIGSLIHKLIREPSEP
ncbi:MAG: hypothetical protein KC777_11715 [Cyanobacteria bacterium HKST-UBA02]|nr:hypothetical protein [Cyanobacteria bacterium HKST-UBA02]